jgi:hypothetical protein
MLRTTPNRPQRIIRSGVAMSYEIRAALMVLAMIAIGWGVACLVIRR